MTDYSKLTDRELDAVIAEKVMEWRRTIHWSGSTPIPCLVHPTDGSYLPDEFPHYSTDITDAFHVVGKIMKLDGNDWGHFTLLAFTTNWRAGWKTPNMNDMPSEENDFRGFSTYTEAPTAPRAICLAALRVMEEE